MIREMTIESVEYVKIIERKGRMYFVISSNLKLKLNSISRKLTLLEFSNLKL